MKQVLFSGWLVFLMFFGLGCSTESGGGSEPNESNSSRYMLVVDKFGEGVVIDEGSTINCGENCSSKQEEGSTVVLTATPSDGWEFHHWEGCDKTSSNTCTVTIDKDRTVFPSFSSKTMTLGSNVHELDESTMSLLIDTAGTTLIFDASASVIASLKPGDVIISKSGEGFLRKVTKVIMMGSSSIIVETADATLEDAIENGTIVYSKPLTTDDLQSTEALIEGARLVLPENDSVASRFKIQIDHVLYDKDGNHQTTNDQVKMIGSTSFGFTPDFGISFGFFKLREFRSIIHVSNTVELSLESSAGYDLFKKEIPLYSFHFGAIPAGPILLFPEVQVKAIFQGNASVSVVTTVSFDQTASVGVHYRSGKGWNSVGSYDKIITFTEPALSGEVSLECGIGSEMNIKIFKITGPFFLLNPYLAAKATETINSSLQCIDWGLYAGFRSTVGAEVKILAWTLARFEATIFDFKKTLCSGNIGNCSNNPAPLTPSNLVVIPVSSSQMALSWDGASKGERVDYYSVFRDGNFIGITSDNTYTDQPLQELTRYCYSVSATGLNGNESLASPTICARTKQFVDTEAPTVPAGVTASALSSSAAKLSWNASTDNIGVAGYTVYRDSSPIMTTTELSMNDSSLQSSSTYCYSVKAFDEAGNQSAASKEPCITTHTIGNWDVYIKCDDDDKNENNDEEENIYQVKFNFDLNETIVTNIQETGTGQDYNGKELAYVLHGTYDPATYLLNGTVTWTFAGSTCVRKDTIKNANLSTGDSGDITISQDPVCGCTSQIRFIRNGVSSSFDHLKIQTDHDDNDELFNSVQ